jgi:hypothetical protein
MSAISSDAVRCSRQTHRLRPASGALRAAALAVLALASCASPRPSFPIGSIPVTHNNDPIVQELLAQTLSTWRQWLNGDSRPAAALMAHTPTFTIFGPFGGPSPPGWSEESANAQAATARMFQGGTAEIELVQSYVSDDLIVLVTIERSQVRFGGQDGPRAWNLRTTQVYQRIGDAWKIVHRHADPFIARRDLQQTLEILQP